MQAIHHDGKIVVFAVAELVRFVRTRGSVTVKWRPVEFQINVFCRQHDRLFLYSGGGSAKPARRRAWHRAMNMMNLEHLAPACGAFGGKVEASAKWTRALLVLTISIVLHGCGSMQSQQLAGVVAETQPAASAEQRRANVSGTHAAVAKTASRRSVKNQRSPTPSEQPDLADAPKSDETGAKSDETGTMKTPVLGSPAWKQQEDRDAKREMELKRAIRGICTNC